MDNSEGHYQVAQRDIDQHLQRISASQYSFIIYEAPDMDVSPFIRAYAPESNIDILTDVVAASGYFSIVSDRDGMVRWVPLMIQAGEELFPPLAVVSAWHYL